MTLLGLLVALISAGWLFAAARKNAPLPLLLGATYMTQAQGIQIGSLDFPVFRILIAVGFVRVLVKQEKIWGGLKGLDWAMLAWATWAVISTVFHGERALVFRLGMVYNYLGIYFLFRVFLRDTDDIKHVFKGVCVLFVPLAGAMVFEKLTGHNPFAALGGVSEQAALRHGHFRAQGPFGHPILAGTVGAVCFPMALCFWHSDRRRAWIGLGATAGIVAASGSSGPLMTVVTIAAVLVLWKRRQYLRPLCWLALLAIFVLHLIMNDPVYYLMARIDITGGSTGWHRAALIDASIRHLNEWWLGGTDYTRNWMPTGVYWSKYHTDITNHYIAMGVYGGLPLMFLFLGIIATGFASVGRVLRAMQNAPGDQQFLVWTLGAILFGHATNFLSISYFDQSVVFLSFLLACIGSLAAIHAVVKVGPSLATNWSPAGPQTDPLPGAAATFRSEQFPSGS